MNRKKASRLRRARRSRSQIRRLGVPRLSVHRSGRHLYAQVIAPDGGTVLAAANTLQKAVRETLGDASTSDRAAAAAVGKTIAERAVAAGVEAVAFDRSGFKYHGRIKALADAARESGLKF